MRKTTALVAFGSDFSGSLEGEHHDLQGQQHPEHAGREHPAMLPEVRDAGGLADLAPSKDQDQRTGNQERGDREDLDQREPELELAEQPDRDQVDAVEHAERDDRRDPLRQLGEPVVRVDPDGGNLGHAGDHPREPVRPARGEAGEGADILLGVGGERAGDRAVQQEFAERAHDEEDHDAADGIGEDEAGAGLGDRPARAEEQADADRAPERDQLDVTILEAAMQVARLALLFGVERRLVHMVHGFLRAWVIGLRAAAGASACR